MKVRSNRKISVKKAVLSAALACTMLTQPAYAASVSDLNIRGWAAFLLIPRRALRRGSSISLTPLRNTIRTWGAEVAFVHNRLRPNGGPENENTKGLYWHRTSNIEICIMEKWDPLQYYQTVTHELGNFLYFKTYPLWSQEMKDQLETQFQYWKPYSEECPDKEETFAFLYAMYRAYGSPYLSEECMQMIRDAEEICTKLYNADLEGLDISVGPGVIGKVRSELSLPGADSDGSLEPTADSQQP